MSDKVVSILIKLRDGIDTLTTIGDEDANEEYNEGVFDSVKLVDEMIHQYEMSPEDVIDELNVDLDE